MAKKKRPYARDKRGRTTKILDIDNMPKLKTRHVVVKRVPRGAIRAYEVCTRRGKLIERFLYYDWSLESIEAAQKKLRKVRREASRYGFYLPDTTGWQYNAQEAGQEEEQDDQKHNHVSSDT
jgi:hypothetical protein